MIPRYNCEIMNLLSRSIENPAMPLAEANRRRSLLDRLINLFGRSFPGIAYELIWESTSINAQAWCLGESHVRVYGGLARNPFLTRAGLSLVLAHETGHHLGGAPYDPAMPWLSWQGQADFWAASVGMPILWGAGAKRMTLKGAREISSLSQALGDCSEVDVPDISMKCRTRIFKAGALGRPLPRCAERSTNTFCRTDLALGLREVIMNPL